MRKRPLRGVLADFCQKCDSVWLDGGELEKLLVGVELSTGELLAQVEHERTTERRKRIEVQGMCPRCQAPLHIAYVGPIEVDRCAACSGTYFDPGELPETLEMLRPGLLKRLWLRFQARRSRWGAPVR